MDEEWEPGDRFLVMLMGGRVYEGKLLYAMRDGRWEVQMDHGIISVFEEPEMIRQVTR